MLNKEMLLLNSEKDEPGVLEAQIDTGIHYDSTSIFGFYDNESNHFVVDDPGYDHTQIMHGEFPFMLKYDNFGDACRPFAIKNCELSSGLPTSRKIARLPEIGVGIVFISPQNPNKRCVMALKCKPYALVTITPALDNEEEYVYPVTLSISAHGDISKLFPLSFTGYAGAVTDDGEEQIWDSTTDGALVLKHDNFNSEGKMTLFKEHSGQYISGYLDFEDNRLDFQGSTVNISAPWPE